MAAPKHMTITKAADLVRETHPEMLDSFQYFDEATFNAVMALLSSVPVYPTPSTLTSMSAFILATEDGATQR